MTIRNHAVGIVRLLSRRSTGRSPSTSPSVTVAMALHVNQTRSLGVASTAGRQVAVVPLAQLPSQAPVRQLAERRSSALSSGPARCAQWSSAGAAAVTAPEGGAAAARRRQISVVSRRWRGGCAQHVRASCPPPLFQARGRITPGPGRRWGGSRVAMANRLQQQHPTQHHPIPDCSHGCQGPRPHLAVRQDWARAARQGGAQSAAGRRDWRGC